MVDYFRPETPAFVWYGMELFGFVNREQLCQFETGLDAYIAVLGEAANRSALELVKPSAIKDLVAERDYLEPQAQGSVQVSRCLEPRPSLL